MKLVQMPRGAESVGHGHEVYVVRNHDWTVWLPDDVADFMVEDGRSGARIIEEPDHPDAVTCPYCKRTFMKET